jgi:hypothetical protein
MTPPTRYAEIAAEDDADAEAFLVEAFQARDRRRLLVRLLLAGLGLALALSLVL